MKKREGLLLVFLSCFISLLTPPASAAPQLSARVSSLTVFSDESLTLTLDVDWAQGSENYTFVLPVPPVKNLTLKRQGESQETYQQGNELRAKKTFVFEFVPVEPSSAAIESFSFNYVETEAGTPGVLQVPSFDIAVRKRGLPPVLLGGLAGCAGLVLGAVLFFIVKKKRRSGEKSSGPVLSVEERASGALRQLPAVSSQEEALSKGGVVYQAYLTEKYSLPSASFDLAVLTKRLEEKGLDALEIKKSRQLVEKMREARYSGVPFSSSEVREILEEAASWIDRRKVIGASAS